MKIKWYAHAAVLFQGEGVRIIADPYLPADVGFETITEPADIVVRSSADDLSHCYAEMIRGMPGVPESPIVVTATELEPEGTTVRGITFIPIHSQESLIYKERPRDNAMYRFTLDGIRLAHLGDVGNALTTEQRDALRGVDVMLAPTGGPPTIDLADLMDALYELRPLVFIPIHYALPGAIPKLLGIRAFTDRFPADQVTWHDSSEIELDVDTLPSALHVVVLKPSTAPSA